MQYTIARRLPAARRFATMVVIVAQVLHVARSLCGELERIIVLRAA